MQNVNNKRETRGRRKIERERLRERSNKRERGRENKGDGERKTINYIELFSSVKHVQQSSTITKQ